MIKTISALWVLAIPAYKIVFSTYHYLTAKYYLFIYEKYINGYFKQQKQEESQDENRNKEYQGNSKNLSKILAHKNRMIRLLKQANVDDHQIPYMQPIGLGRCVSNVMSIYMNLEKTITIDIPGQGSAFIPHEIYVSLRQAKGIYKLQIYDAINPIYWADSIINLPGKILEYFKGDQVTGSLKNIVRAVNIIYWLGLTIGAIFISH